MPRFTKRDLGTILVFIGFAVVVTLLVLLGNEAWALVVTAALVSIFGVISRVEFATRRNDLRAGRKDSRDNRRVLDTIQRATRAEASALEQLVLNVTNLGSAVNRLNIPALADRVAGIESEIRKMEFAALTAQVSSVQAEIRGMRVAQQLISQTITSTKTDLVKSTHSNARFLDDVQAMNQLFSKFTPVVPLPSLSDSGERASNIYFLVDVIEQRKVTCVTHRGGRATSLWMAYALRRRGHGNLVVLAEDEESADQTRAMFAEHGLIGWGEVRVVPRADDNYLDETVATHGADGFGDRRCIDLLVLDMDSTNATAGEWYPTTAALKRILIPGARVVVSNTQRADVREVIRRWEDSYPALVRLESTRRDTVVLALETVADELVS